MQKKWETSETIIENQKISYIYSISKDAKNLTFFLHGWGSSASSFLKLFTNQKNFLAMDFPGAGKSSELQKVFTLEDYSRITQKFLEKFIKKNNQHNKKLIVVGHSFGGRIIMKLLDMFKETYNHSTIEKIIFIAVPFYKEKNVKTLLIKNLTKIFSVITPQFLKSKLRTLAHKIIGENDYFDLAENKIMKRTFQSIVSDESDISQYISHLQEFSDNQLFCFWGEKDIVIPISFAKKVQSKIGKKFHIFSIPEAEHFPWIGKNSNAFMKHWKNLF